MEGFLPLEWCLVWGLLALPFVVYGMRQLRRLFREEPEKKILVAVAGAFLFVLSSLKLPSVTGSSSHPTGTGVSTVLYGVGITSVLASIVLVFQALLLAHGGLTTLGANVFSMGVAGPLVAFAAYKALSSVGAPRWGGVMVAAFLADFVTYIVTSLQLALAFPGPNGALSSFEMFLGVFAITQIPLAIAEGVITVLFFDFLFRTRPEMLEAPVRTPSRGRGTTTVALSVVGALLVGLTLVPVVGGMAGTDDMGAETALSINPDMIPWASSLWEPSEGVEIALFALQGLLGLLIIAYALRRMRTDRVGSLVRDR